MNTVAKRMTQVALSIVFAAVPPLRDAACTGSCRGCGDADG